MKTNEFKKVGGSYVSNVKIFNSETDSATPKWTITYINIEECWEVRKFNKDTKAYALSAKFRLLDEGKRFIEAVENCIPYFTYEDRSMMSKDAEKILKEEGAKKAAELEAAVYAETCTGKLPQLKAEPKTAEPKIENNTSDISDKAKVRKATAEVMNRSSVSSRLVLLEATINAAGEVTYVLFQVGSKEYNANKTAAGWETKITNIG